MEIKILGAGCARCANTKKLVADVAAELGVEVRIEAVSDVMKIMEYDLMSTPGVVIDGEVVSSGKVPARAEVVTWIQERNRSEGS